MNINQATIIGRITGNIELKTLTSGTSVVSFSVATNRIWKDKDGNKNEEAEYHNVVAFGKTAENISKYMGKGDEIYIQGRLKTSSWKDEKNQVKRRKTEIICENMQFGQKVRKDKHESKPINLDDIPF